MAASTHVPLRVTFHLATPIVVPTFDKTLDAVLSWARVQQATAQGHADPISLQHDLPVARHLPTVEQDWCFKASNLEYHWCGDRFMTFRIKRQKLTDYVDAFSSGVLRKPPAVDSTRGVTAAGLYETARRPCDQIKAWCIGDPQALRELLRQVTFLGKMHARGAGQVQQIDVDEDDHALVAWTNRSLPVSSPLLAADGAGRSDMLGALRAPYWKRENFQVVKVLTNSGQIEA